MITMPIPNVHMESLLDIFSLFLIGHPVWISQHLHYFHDSGDLYTSSYLLFSYLTIYDVN